MELWSILICKSVYFRDGQDSHPPVDAGILDF